MAGLGRIRGWQQVDPYAWYFKAHFFQDPVQPGSLGQEALIQLLQEFMYHKGLLASQDSTTFEPIALGIPFSWRFRGQVLPTNLEVVTELDITDILVDNTGSITVTANGSLWADGLRIYELNHLTVRAWLKPR